MATANWFNSEFYMSTKLAQMIANDPDGGWTLPKLVQAFGGAGFVGPEGAQAHFEAFGQNEGLSPNPYFNPTEYYRAKAAQFYGKDAKAVTDLDAANIELMIKQAGMNAWSHYTNFGSAEGVNPSNSFDTNAYMAAKLAAMQLANPDGAWTPAKLLAAFQAAGFSALEHFMMFGGTGVGTGSGEVAQKYDPANPSIPFEFSVADSDKVTPDPVNGGKTYDLVVGEEHLTGTMYGDVFNATNTTLTNVDSIDGGAGKDTFNYTSNAVAAFPTAAIKNVEVFKFNDIGASNNLVVDFATIDGELEVWSDRSTNASATGTTFSNLATGTLVGMIGDKTATNNKLVFSYATGTDEVNLVLADGVKQGKVDAGISTTSTATVATITSKGAANQVGQVVFSGNKLTNVTLDAQTDLTITTTTATFAGIDGFDNTSDAATLMIKGAGKVDLGLLDADLDVLDASANTGGLKAGLGAGSEKIKITGTAVADTITVGTLVLTGSVDAGAGKDTLVVTDGTAITDVTGKLYKNFEVLSVEDGVSVDVSVLAATNAIESIVVNGGSGTTKVTNMTAAQAANVTVKGGDTGVITFGIQGAETPGQIDTLKLLVDDGEASKGTITLTTPVMKSIENLEVVANDNLTITAMSGITSLGSLKVSGAGDIDITTDAAAFASNATFDFSAVTGKVTLDASAATSGLVIKGSLTGVNTLVDTELTDLISGGAANDTLTYSGGADTISLGGGADTVDLNSIVGSTATGANGMTFKFANGDSVSKAGVANGYDDLKLTDTIDGITNDAAFGATAGTKFTIDTVQTATSVALTGTAVVFGTTTVEKAFGFLVVTDNNDAYVYQDTDGNGKIDAGEFAIKLVGQTQPFTAGEFAVVGGDLVFTSV